MKMTSEEDQMQELSGKEEKVYVSVRLRPLNEKEAARYDVSDWECINNTTVIYKSHLSISERSMYPSAYTFDRVFGPESCTRQVYDQGAKEVALSVVNGVNASVFAYGQTSSGKTYTMSGITDYAMSDIYEYIDQHKEREFSLKFSAMEIYNESVRDLLSTDSSPLRLLDDPEKGTVVEKLTEETLRDWNHFKELLSVCKAQRQIGETALNEVSSRSHQILRLTIESTAREYLANDKLSTLTATVNFIDLAGSERASQSLSAGTRLKEGCHINRSLLTLGTVIRKLSKGKTGHIPFRDSKLTRILQSSLGGNARTAIICTMSPARIHVEQSRNTLLFASCAKEVATNAQVNVVMSDKALVKHLQKELARLEDELRSPGRAFIDPDTAALLRAKDLQIEKLNKEVLQLTQQLELSRIQINDFHQRAGEEKQPEKDVSLEEQDQMELGDYRYPKLRVRNSWDLDNATLESPVSAQPSSISPRSTVHSYDENVFQLSDFRIDSAGSSSPHHLPYGAPRFRIHGTETKEQTDVRKEEQSREMDGQPDGNFENHCMEVKCTEMESSISGYSESNTVASSLNLYEDTSGLTMSKAESSGSLRLPTEAKANEENVKDESEKLDRDMSSLRRNLVLPDLVSPSPENTYSCLARRDSESVRGLRLTRSRSCGASFISKPSLSWIDRYEKSGYTPPSWYEKEFIKTTESTQSTPVSSYNIGNERSLMNDSRKMGFKKDMNGRSVSSRFGNKTGLSSPNDLQACPSDASMFELRNFNNEEKATNQEEAVAHKEKHMNHHHRMEDMEEKSMSVISSKNCKDAALDPIQDYLGSPEKWPLEFERLQKEIIELWHKCNVSLGHRTYFFLLFRGDEKDCLYLEVEFRRLKYIRELFHHGSKTVEHGHTLSPTSSMRALNRERYKLSQLMQKKLTKEERENLFLRWGIGLNTKHRRLQLAHRLWSETKDMEHIRESSSVVGKLLGYVDMDMASKEMFGLNFAVRQRPPKKPSRWKRSVLSLSFV